MDLFFLIHGKNNLMATMGIMIAAGMAIEKNQDRGIQ